LKLIDDLRTAREESDQLKEDLVEDQMEMIWDLLTPAEKKATEHFAWRAFP